jgi:hypothetical protein
MEFNCGAGSFACSLLLAGLLKAHDKPPERRLQAKLPALQSAWRSLRDRPLCIVFLKLQLVPGDGASVGQRPGWQFKNGMGAQAECDAPLPHIRTCF